MFCTTYGSILSTPLDLLEFPDFTIFIISVGSVGAQKSLQYCVLCVGLGPPLFSVAMN